MPLKVRLFNLVAGAKGLVEHLAGDQVAIPRSHHGVGAARRGGLEGDVDEHAGSPVDLDDYAPLEVGCADHDALNSFAFLSFLA